MRSLTNASRATAGLSAAALILAGSSSSSSSSSNSSTLSWADSFSSHMVLQQLPSPTVLWGFAPAGATVSVTRMTGSMGTPTVAASNVTSADGVWWVMMPGQQASSRFRSNLTTEVFHFQASARLGEGVAGTTTIDLLETVYGDVWVCSGQSNMAVMTAQVFNASDVVQAAAEYTDQLVNPLRLFAVNMSCGHGKVCHFQEKSNRLSQCTRPPCFTTGPNAKWTPASPAALSSDGNGTALPVWTGSFSAVCYLFGRRIQAARGYPIGLVSTFIGGTPDECWSSKEALKRCPATPHSKAHMDWGDCWYSMITPLLRTPVFGAIFYQGETDTDVGGASKEDASRAANYNCTFSAMVDDWRRSFHSASYGITSRTFPFGVVQIAPWALGGKKDLNDACGASDDCEVAKVRWGQTGNRGTLINNSVLPNSFLAVTTDLGDFDSPYGSIHPRHKIPVGDRLSLGARSVAYGERGVYWTGPVYPSASMTHDGRIRVQFRNCAPGQGLVLRETAGFEVFTANTPGGNGVWRAVAAMRNASAQASCAVELESGSSLHARRLRYNWFRSTCFANETKEAICGSEGCGAGRCAVYSGGGGSAEGLHRGGSGVTPTPNSAAVPPGLPAPPFMISVEP
jgi:sialate O-acetylesterase